MIIFDQLRISDDGKTLYISAHVNGAKMYNDVYIDSITIMTSDKVSETDPGTPTENYIYTQKVSGNEKEINIALTSTDFTKLWETDPKAMVFKQADMTKTLFFVYIKAKISMISMCPPCGSDNLTTLGVTFYEQALHQKVMSYTKELTQECCNIPIGFIDFILLWNAFKASIETEHFISAIKFYNMLFDGTDSTSVAPVKGCNCNG